MTFSKVHCPTVVVILLSLTFPVTSQEVSITRGETALIPCPFEEGTVRNISWYYLMGSETVSQKILTLFKGDLLIEEAYAIRAGLDEDNSTLILKKIMVKDEGTYRCDVDRQGQQAVRNINTKLKVYGLSPNSVPTIRQCPQRPSNCSCCTFTANGPTSLTCEFSNVYPSSNVLLEWYLEGRSRQDVNSSISQANEDGTFDLTSTVKVSETGNWTCRASYLSVDGTEHTEAPISVKLLGDNDETDSPTNLVAIIVPIVVVIAVVVGIVIFFLLWRRKKHRDQAKGQYGQVELGDKSKAGIEDEQLANLAEALQDNSNLAKLGRNLGFRQSKMNQVIQRNNEAKDVFATTSLLFEWKKKTSPAKEIPTMVKALEKSDLESLITQFFPNEAGVSDEKLAELAENIDDDDAIEQLGINFGFRRFKVNQYFKSNKDHGDHSGTLDMLQEWKKKTPRTQQIPELVEALKNSNLDASFNNNKDN